MVGTNTQEEEKKDCVVGVLGTGRGSALVTRGWEEPERAASTVWRRKLSRAIMGVLGL